MTDSPVIAHTHVIVRGRTTSRDVWVVVRCAVGEGRAPFLRLDLRPQVAVGLQGCIAGGCIAGGCIVVDTLVRGRVMMNPPCRPILSLPHTK